MTTAARNVLWMGAVQCGLALLYAAPAFANPSDTSYRLVFADEFNGTTLDTNKWSAASPSWTMPNSLSTATASQVSLANGIMTMNATRTGSSTWTSGSISSYGKYNFAGGYVEARIQLPTTPGSWPAFWGLYTGWPPEADIMEYPLTTDGGASGLASNKYNTSFHYTNSSGSAAAGAGVVTAGSSLAGTWHTFAMDWTSGTSVKFLLDGTQVQSFSSSSVAQMANMYMILDYAVGGWPGTPSTSQWAIGASDQTNVDWVHVWQKNANGDTTSNWNLDGSGSFTTSGNWANGISPSYGNQTAYFGRVGTSSGALVSMPSWRVFGNITFDGNATTGTTAYTIGTSSSSIQLANTTAAPLVQATANSTANQTVGAKVELWNTSTFKNDMTGGQTLNINGQVSGNGALNVTGVGAVNLNAANTYSGGTNVGTAQEAAVLRANATNALGTGSVVIGPAGNASTARLELNGNITLPNAIDFRGRNNNSVGIQNISGNNTLAGTVSANVGGGVYAIQSDAGTLSLSGTANGVALSAVSGTRTFTLQGAGAGTVAKIQNGGGTVSITKAGSGTWTLNGANTYTGATTVTAGVLKATAGASNNFLTNAGGLDIQSSGSVGLTYAAGSSPAAAVKAILDANYANGFTAGQIRSTNHPAGQTIGYGDNGTDTVALRLTLPGDADLNGTVDFNDFLALQANFGQASTRFDQGNFNYDGATDFNDFLLLQANFGQTVNGDAAANVTPAEIAYVKAIQAIGQVPEPTSLAGTAIVSALLLRRRHPRRS